MERLGAIECGQTEDRCLPPAAAFSLVANETRVRILEALWTHDDPPVSFSTLSDAIEADTSARFNYHLGQLVGAFVRKTDAGYELRTAGEHVVQAIVEGSFTAHPTIDPVETDGTCVDCGASLLATYDDERLQVACGDCARVHADYAVPPGALLDRRGEALLAAADRLVRSRVRLAADGVCPACGGRMATTLRQDGDGPPAVDTWVAFSCEQCRHSLAATVGLALLDHPRVVAARHTSGVDREEGPFWQLPWCVTDDGTRIEATDPVTLAVDVPVGDEPHTLRVDDELTLLETTHA